MPQTDSSSELISTGEMKIYVGMSNPNLRDRYFQHLIRGWMKFVAPLTPSKLEDVPRLECVQDATEPFERIPAPIWFLLGIMSEIACKAQGQLSGSVFPSFSKAWPTMWVWIRHTYRAHHDCVHRLAQTMDAAQKSQLADRYGVFAAILQSLIYHAKQPVISKILSDYPEIFAMMADMWIGEAKDEKMVHGFRAGAFTGQVNPSEASEQRFVAQIILACGGAEEAVNLACQRLERNPTKAKEDYNAHFVDLHFFAASVTNPESAIAPAMLASSRVAQVLMHTWAHVTSGLFSGSVETRDGYIDICMSSISVLVERSPRAYEILRDVLHHNFIPLCLNSIPLVRSGSGDCERVIEEAHSVLLEILPPATVHREILSLMERSITSPQLKFLPKDQHDVLTKPCRELWHTIQRRRNAYKEHRQDRSRCVLLCGNAKCGGTAESGMLRRCSSCKISLYCNRLCQKQHWLSHKVLCNAMKGKIEDCVDLSYPNLHFLSYLIANDLKVQEVGIRSWRGLLPKENRYTGRPALFLDFCQLDDHVASIRRMDANDRSRRFPFLDDAFLYNKWCRLFDVPSEVLPVLVAIPRGASGTDQVMTALLHELNDDAVGIRWLHCQLVFADVT